MDIEIFKLLGHVERIVRVWMTKKIRSPMWREEEIKTGMHGHLS